MRKHSIFWIEKISKPSIIFLLLFLFIIFQLIFQMGLMPEFKKVSNDNRILDFELVKSRAVAYEMISGYGETGIKFYNYIQIVDIFYPIAYSLLLAALICYLLKSAVSRFKYVCLFPLAGALFDYAENLGIFLMLRIYPKPFHSIAAAAHAMSILKFSFIILSILIVIVLGFNFILKFIKHFVSTQV